MGLKLLKDQRAIKTDHRSQTKRRRVYFLNIYLRPTSGRMVLVRRRPPYPLIAALLPAMNDNDIMQ